jgi:beta-catenin-like protein 1
VDNLLQLLSVYRKRDPERDSDEEEYVKNLFDCLTCIVDEDEGKDRFIEGEGIELAQAERG